MEYIGTLLVAVICFWLGYVFGAIKSNQKAYDDGYFHGHFDALYEEQQKDKVKKWITEKEEQK